MQNAALAPDPAERRQRELLCEMLRLFYDKEWVSGTGGGMCATLAGGRVLVAPTGVHKERVRPEDLFVVDAATSAVLLAPAEALRPSECTPIFSAIIASRSAGSVVHSHALSAVVAADLAEGSVLMIDKLEMLKGIPGLSNTDVHLVPVIDNTAREPALTGAVLDVLAQPRFEKAYAILVRDHGAYIWGADVWAAKKHAEVYHFLFDAASLRRR